MILQRETYEFRSVSVSTSTGTYSGAWSYQITAIDARPVGEWLPSVTHAAKSGFVIQNLAKGDHWLWIRPDDDNPYLPVLEPVLFSVQ